jgi:hypothetical protein
VPKASQCTPTPPAARDNVTGWFIYYCGGGTLLVPAARCVGPECRGAAPGQTKNIGYAGDIAAGTRGSFTQGARSIGVTAMDGVEIAQGLAAIDDLRARNEIDAYYAASAKNAFIERTQGDAERPAPFEGPSPFGSPLAPRALARRYKGITGEDVGATVSEACRCTPRPFDARDPVSGWGIYYVGTGVLLTPTPKCIGGSGRPLSFWAKTWRNVLELARPYQQAAPAMPQPQPYHLPVPRPAPSVPTPSTPGAPDIGVPAGALVQVCKPGFVRLVYERDIGPLLAAGWTRC